MRLFGLNPVGKQSQISNGVWREKSKIVKILNEKQLEKSKLVEVCPWQQATNAPSVLECSQFKHITQNICFCTPPHFAFNGASTLC